MRNFSIQNKSDVSVVEIFGDIGESWFGEGNSIDSVNAQLKEIKSKKIELRVASLGGDVNHALVIHDIIKMHPAKVTAKIMGATASSGTIVSMAADKVEMSDNSLFLVHNVWTVAMGNAEDMRETAEALEMHDDRLVNIYQKKTGKPEQEIRDLMAEEKWISPDEAKEFGFVDEVFEPIKAAASLSEEKKQEILNKIKNEKRKEMDLKQAMAELKNWVSDGFQAKEKPEDFEKAVNDKIAEFEAKLSDLETIEAQLTDVSEKAASLETEKADVEQKLQDAETEKAEFKAKFEDMESKYNELKADKTPLQGSQDPPLGDTPPEPKTEIGNEITGLLSEAQKNRLKDNKK